MKKIVIIGPESTGKSTLCEQLAKHFTTLYCPEFARDYLTEHDMEYSFEDLLTIAKGQLGLEEEFVKKVSNQRENSGCIFIDTDMYVMKVWCEYVFGKCHQFILDAIAERKYDLYLLCNIDLPWAYDPLREYPTEEHRKELFRIYKDILINQQTPWAMISGSYGERLQTAIKAIEDFCMNK
ncbi:MAG: AAA family ATPase [Panacibacter sp.]